METSLLAVGKRHHQGWSWCQSQQSVEEGGVQSGLFTSPWQDQMRWQTTSHTIIHTYGNFRVALNPNPAHLLTCTQHKHMGKKHTRRPRIMVENLWAFCFEEKAISPSTVWAQNIYTSGKLCKKMSWVLIIIFKNRRSYLQNLSHQNQHYMFTTVLSVTQEVQLHTKKYTVCHTHTCVYIVCHAYRVKCQM